MSGQHQLTRWTPYAPGLFGLHYIPATLKMPRMLNPFATVKDGEKKE